MVAWTRDMYQKYLIPQFVTDAREGGGGGNSGVILVRVCEPVF